MPRSLLDYVPFEVAVRNPSRKLGKKASVANVMLSKLLPGHKSLSSRTDFLQQLILVSLKSTVYQIPWPAIRFDPPFLLLSACINCPRPIRWAEIEYCLDICQELVQTGTISWAAEILFYPLPPATRFHAPLFLDRSGAMSNGKEKISV